MKTGTTTVNTQNVTVIVLDSITKAEESIIYDFLGGSLYPHSTYYILPFSDKKIADRLRDAMVKRVYNNSRLIIDLMKCQSISEMIDLYKGNEFEF